MNKRRFFIIGFVLTNRGLLGDQLCGLCAEAESRIRTGLYWSMN